MARRYRGTAAIATQNNEAVVSCDALVLSRSQLGFFAFGRYATSQDTAEIVAS